MQDSSSGLVQTASIRLSLGEVVTGLLKAAPGHELSTTELWEYIRHFCPFFQTSQVNLSAAAITREEGLAIKIVGGQCVVALKDPSSAHSKMDLFFPKQVTTFDGAVATRQDLVVEALSLSLPPHELSGASLNSSMRRRYPHCADGPHFAEPLYILVQAIHTRRVPGRADPVYSLKPYFKPHHRVQPFLSKIPAIAAAAGNTSAKTLREMVKDLFLEVGLPDESSSTEVTAYFKVKHPELKKRPNFHWTSWPEYELIKVSANFSVIRLIVRGVAMPTRSTA